MDKCPHCGSENGYYRKTRYKGVFDGNYEFDGSFADGENECMFDGAQYTEAKTARCRDCRKIIKIKE